MIKILIVEDDKNILNTLTYYLQNEGFSVKTAQNINKAIDIIKNEQFNIVLLDITLPDGDGFEVCNLVKNKTNIPVIFLTARDEETNVVKGLDMGADDYVIKPFRTRELISRIRSVLRRYETNTDKEQNQIKCKDIVIDDNLAKVYKNGREIIFTSLEYKILLLLLKNKNILVTRENLLDKIWDIAGNFVNDNTLTVYIKRIREKLDDKDGKIIQTVRGIGYRVVDE